MPSEKKDTVSFRIGPSLNARLAAMSEELGYDKSHLVREAIERYLDAAPGSVEQRLRRLERHVFQDATGWPTGNAETEQLREDLAEANARLLASEVLEEDVTAFFEAAGKDATPLLEWLKLRRQHPTKK